MTVMPDPQTPAALADALETWAQEREIFHRGKMNEIWPEQVAHNAHLRDAAAMLRRMVIDDAAGGTCSEATRRASYPLWG